eukprot:TRINITY_DN2807_c0_g2_i1.p1 TRINITY_DN2807_c0_g2~~TRINITY_DN2807_c0_g2_i1.p1  ORF type:complete len:511 (+),score=141.74 TRINITY_DN2807_c0_g2_i1:80-1534(+)
MRRRSAGASSSECSQCVAEEDADDNLDLYARRWAKARYTPTRSSASHCSQCEASDYSRATAGVGSDSGSGAPPSWERVVERVRAQWRDRSTTSAGGAAAAPGGPTLGSSAVGATMLGVLSPARKSSSPPPAAPPPGAGPPGSPGAADSSISGLLLRLESLRRDMARAGRSGRQSAPAPHRSLLQDVSSFAVPQPAPHPAPHPAPQRGAGRAAQSPSGWRRHVSPQRRPPSPRPLPAAGRRSQSVPPRRPAPEDAPGSSRQRDPAAWWDERQQSTEPQRPRARLRGRSQPPAPPPPLPQGPPAPPRYVGCGAPRAGAAAGGRAPVIIGAPQRRGTARRPRKATAPSPALPPPPAAPPLPPRGAADLPGWHDTEEQHFRRQCARLARAVAKLEGERDVLERERDELQDENSRYRSCLLAKEARLAKVRQVKRWLDVLMSLNQKGVDLHQKRQQGLGRLSAAIEELFSEWRDTRVNARSRAVAARRR